MYVVALSLQGGAEQINNMNNMHVRHVGVGKSQQ